MSAYVLHVYRTEAALVADPELAGWARALGRSATSGGVTGFGAIASRADLTLVLTELIFTASAGHAAVNFPQWTDAGYAPGMSGAGWIVGEQAPSEAAWLASMPPLEKSELHTEFLSLLGRIYYTRLGRYRDPAGGRSPWFRDRAVEEGLLPTFQADLDRVESEIESANADGSRAVPYEHLLPSRVPQSVNV